MINTMEVIEKLAVLIEIVIECSWKITVLHFPR